MKQLAKLTLAIVAFSFMYAANAGPVCTIKSFSGSSKAPVVREGHTSEFYSLVNNGFYTEAARLVSCMVPAGSRVIITDMGFASHTIRVLTGPSYGCVGVVATEYVSC